MHRPPRRSPLASRRSARPLARPQASLVLPIGVASLVTLLVSLLVAALAGCVGSTDARPAGLPADINATFLSKDLDVAEYVERFEGESRAVYAERQAIVAALSLRPGDDVADIGAGTGFFSFLFAEAVGDSGSVYAVEIAPRFLDHLRARAAREAPGVVRVVEGTERSVSLPDASIDLAFVCDVYHHFEHPEASLASLHSALRPGGSLVLIEFERIPGVSPEWLLEHVRAGREVFRAEIEAAGFALAEETRLPRLDGNYILRFERVD
jgi:SAM-dependent methyltransferase